MDYFDNNGCVTLVDSSSRSTSSSSANNSSFSPSTNSRPNDDDMLRGDLPTTKARWRQRRRLPDVSVNRRRSHQQQQKTNQRETASWFTRATDRWRCHAILGHRRAILLFVRMTTSFDRTERRNFGGRLESFGGFFFLSSFDSSLSSSLSLIFLKKMMKKPRGL